MSFFANFLLPQTRADEPDNAGRIGRTGLAVGVLLAGAVVAWTAFAPIGGAAIAPGFVKVDMNRRTVQHQEGGIVGELLVRDGQRVKAGDALIVLKDVRVDASRELVQTQLDAELAKSARLAAEQTRAASVAFPNELAARRSDARIASLVDRETTLFRTRRAALDAQIALIARQIRETEEEIAARERQLVSDREALKLQREELAQNQSLSQQGFVSRTRLIALERSVAELSSRIAENEAERARSRQKTSDLALRAETLRSQFSQEAAAELRQSTAQVFDLRERLRPTQDAGDRQRILAPVDGEVVDLKITTIGAVIGPRDPILDIVPADPELVIQAHVRPEDINFVRGASSADVRLTAFRQRITPIVRGKVIYVSADRLVDKQTGAGYYVAHVVLSAEALAAAGDLKLQAGMPAEVYIRTTSRTPLEYFFDPLTGFAQRAMREH